MSASQLSAARQRGLSVLANTGPQTSINIRLPVLPETGVIVPGKSVRYVDDGSSQFGYVRSVSVESNFPQMWQLLTIESK